MRFCSWCGEQIKARTLIWPFCDSCSGRFRPLRIILVIAMVLSLLGAFLVGRSSRPQPKLYFIGTPIDLGQDSPSIKVTSPAIRDGRPDSLVETICGAPTKSGRPCQRKVKGGGYCWQHRNK
jgi:hypothetical protein